MTAENGHRIAVISDTHNDFPEVLRKRLESADEIWHLGDLSNESIHNALLELGKPISVVQGNTDPPGLWPPRLEIERHGIRFALQHFPPNAPDENIVAILHGHIHYPVNEYIGRTRVLCPGAITGPRNGSESSFAWIELDGDSWTWNVETL